LSGEREERGLVEGTVRGEEMVFGKAKLIGGF
jgi:hypothetical protein